MPKFKITLTREKIITYAQEAVLEFEAESVEVARKELEERLCDRKFRRDCKWEDIEAIDQDAQNYEIFEIKKIKEGRRCKLKTNSQPKS